MKKLSRVLLVVVVGVLLVGLVIGLSGCSLVNKLRAKNNLNEGVRDYNNGKYQLAEGKFAFALSLDPDNANAQLFYARSINSQFEAKQTSELGQQAIDAYQNVINHSQNDPGAADKALLFQANLYKELAGLNPDKADMYNDKSTEALLKRADLPTATNDSKATVYYTIGHDNWQSAYNLSKPSQKMIGGKIDMAAIPPDTANKMKPLLLKAHEYLNKAIALKPDYADAWVIQKLSYMQDSYIETDPNKKAELLKQIDDCDKKAKQLYEDQKQQAAQAALAAPSPSGSK